MNQPDTTTTTGITGLRKPTIENHPDHGQFVSTATTTPLERHPVQVISVVLTDVVNMCLIDHNDHFFYIHVFIVCT